MNQHTPREDIVWFCLISAFAISAAVIGPDVTWPIVAIMSVFMVIWLIRN